MLPAPPRCEQGPCRISGTSGVRGIPGGMEHPACHPRWLQAGVWAGAGPSFCSGSPRPWNRCLSSSGCVGSRGRGAPGSQLPRCRGRLLAAAFLTPTFSRFQRSKKQRCLCPCSTQCWEQDTPPAGSLWLGWVRTTPSQHLLPPSAPAPTSHEADTHLLWVGI